MVLAPVGTRSIDFYPSREVIISLIQSSQLFPVDFENAIEWWDARTKNGESVRKSDLKDKLAANFDKDIDYKIDNGLNPSDSFAEISAKPYGGRPREIIFLTVECETLLGGCRLTRAIALQSKSRTLWVGAIINQSVYCIQGIYIFQMF